MNGIFPLSNINFVTSVEVFLSKYNGDYASQKEKKMSSEESQVKTDYPLGTKIIAIGRTFILFKIDKLKFHKRVFFFTNCQINCLFIVRLEGAVTSSVPVIQHVVSLILCSEAMQQ